MCYHTKGVHNQMLHIKSGSNLACVPKVWKQFLLEKVCNLYSITIIKSASITSSKSEYKLSKSFEQTVFSLMYEQIYLSDDNCSCTGVNVVVLVEGSMLSSLFGIGNLHL